MEIDVYEFNPKQAIWFDGEILLNITRQIYIIWFQVVDYFIHSVIHLGKIVINKGK